MAIISLLSFAAISLAGSVVALTGEKAADFGYASGVDVWCGKAYRETNGSFEPGGWLKAPALSSVPLLDVSIRPRMNLYLAHEQYATFLISVGLSYMNGKPFANASFNKQDNLTSPLTELFIDVEVIETGFDLVSGQTILVNTTNNEIGFSLTGLTARIDPYEVVLTVGSGDGAQFYTATADLYYLPERMDGGSVVKVDALYGGLQVQDYLNNATAFSPLFPYTYYVSWDGWLELSIDNVQVFKDRGYNIIHIVPNAGLENEAFDFDELEKWLDMMDELELWLMFDMRWTYMNLTSVEIQVERIMEHKSLLLWYTGDEPDGQVDPLNATKLTYDLIKSIDPYHPVSLCLNCLNYYFEEYTLGADIIMSDPYPIAVNTSWSIQYDTACNTTYGCCGCDDCEGEFEDVSNRLDTYKSYQEWLGLPQKPQWGVPQAFGNETFWARYPTPGEEIVMNMLFINHGAKGIAMWDYPTEPGIDNATSALAKVVTSPTITNYLLSSFVGAADITGLQRVDVAYWTTGNSTLVSVVNKNYVDNPNATVTIELPGMVGSVGEVVWGSGWEVGGGKLVKTGLSALEVDIFVVS